MADINSSLPVRTIAAGDVQVNILGGSTGGVIIDPASEGTLGSVLAGITGIEAQNVSILAGVTGIEAINTSILSGVTGLEATDAAILSGVTAGNVLSTNILAGVTGIQSFQAPILAGITGLEVSSAQTAAGVTAGNVLSTAILAGVTGLEAQLATQLPAGLGAVGMAASLPVTMATDQTPMPVYITSGASSTPVVQFDTAAAVAYNSGLTGVYEPATAFVLNNVHASGSGRIKVEVYAGLIAGWANDNTRRKWVAFNSTANPNVDIDCSDYKLAATTTRVQVVVTNIESGKAQDLYSTIVGDAS